MRSYRDDDAHQEPDAHELPAVPLGPELGVGHVEHHEPEAGERQPDLVAVAGRRRGGPEHAGVGAAERQPERGRDLVAVAALHLKHVSTRGVNHVADGGSGHYVRQHD